MLRPLVASDVMFAHYAVKRNITYAVNIIAEGYIIRRSRLHLHVRANIVRRTCFIAGRRSSLFLYRKITKSFLVEDLDALASGLGDEPLGDEVFEHP